MRALAGSTLHACGAASSGPTPAHPALPMASSAVALHVSSSHWPLQLRVGVRVRGIHAVAARLPMGLAGQAWRSFLALRSGVPESYRTALRSARAGRIAQQVRSRSVEQFKIPHYLRKSPRPRRAGGCGVWPSIRDTVPAWRPAAHSKAGGSVSFRHETRRIPQGTRPTRHLAAATGSVRRTSPCCSCSRSGGWLKGGAGWPATRISRNP